jgi:glycosyltransferase involved in cell wall biosynthesis
MYQVALFNNGLTGGAGKAIVTLAKALKDEGIKVHIVIFKSSSYKVPDGVFLHKLEVEKESKKVVAKALEKKLKELGEFDLILSNSSPSNKILSCLSLPTIYHTVHSSEVKKYSGVFGKIRGYFRKRKYQKLYSNKNLITVSKGLEKIILSEFQAKPKTMQTIYNAFDFEQIKLLAEKDDKTLPKTPFILHLGRYDIAHKRHDILLEAYKKSNIKYPLYLVGDGEDREKILEIIIELNLEKSVFLHGYEKNPYIWIKKAKLLVLSSDFEGFGRVLIEALFLKTPIVSTDAPVGPNEILINNLREFLVPVGDADSLAKSMKRALESYPEIKNYDFTPFSKESIAKAYIKLIEEGKENEK